MTLAYSKTTKLISFWLFHDLSVLKDYKLASHSFMTLAYSKTTNLPHWQSIPFWTCFGVVVFCVFSRKFSRVPLFRYLLAVRSTLNFQVSCFTFPAEFSALQFPSGSCLARLCRSEPTVFGGIHSLKSALWGSTALGASPISCDRRECSLGHSTGNANGSVLPLHIKHYWQ